MQIQEKKKVVPFNLLTSYQGQSDAHKKLIADKADASQNKLFEEMLKVKTNLIEKKLQLLEKIGLDEGVDVSKARCLKWYLSKAQQQKVESSLKVGPSIGGFKKIIDNVQAQYFQVDNTQNYLIIAKQKKLSKYNLKKNIQIDMVLPKVDFEYAEIDGVTFDDQNNLIIAYYNKFYIGKVQEDVQFIQLQNSKYELLKSISYDKNFGILFVDRRTNFVKAYKNKEVTMLYGGTTPDTEIKTRILKEPLSPIFANNSLYIVDNFNNSVVEWSKKNQFKICLNEDSPFQKSLKNPNCIKYHAGKKLFFVADEGNERVVFFYLMSDLKDKEKLFTLSKGSGQFSWLSVGRRCLYVSDKKNKTISSMDIQEIINI